VESLRRYGYEVEQSIGTEYDALKVINPLYQKPYRIVHIAAHGVFDERAADGRNRSGVVLSDGLLLTAAEIGQMEIVPDLVFLNCCHLAKLDARPVAYNRLAYSIARELIEIGVRCVVAAGWAVDDEAAYTFADVFYQGILHEKLQFGDAVFAARRETYRKHGGSFTWGAYQAYGDAGWRVDPRDGAGRRGRVDANFVSPEELIDSVRGIRTEIFQRRETMSKPAARSTAAQLRALLKRCPKNWVDNPVVSFELAETYAALGAEFFEEACKLYNNAIAADDRARRVPITAIEQLANIESKLGEIIGAPELIDRAIERLHDLDKVVAGIVDYESGQRVEASSTKANIERQSLVGSAYKRKAALFARQILDPKTPNRQDSVKQFEDAIRRSIEAYKNACIVCGKKANEKFLRAANVLNAVMAAEAYLVQSLFEGGLGRPSEAGDQTLEEVGRHYADALANVRFVPKDLDAVTLQLCVLALFFEAKGATETRAARATAQAAVAHRLRRLSERIHPGSCAELSKAVREQSPASAEPSPAAPRRRPKRRKR
jgi:hypothetical protein